MEDLILRHKGGDKSEKPPLSDFLERDEKLERQIATLDAANKEVELEIQKGQNEQEAFEGGLELPSISTGSKKLDEKLQNRNLSLYDIYALRKMGIDTTALTNSAQSANLAIKADLGARVKRLNGDKDYEQLKELNNAFENLNSIVANSEETSGIQNHLARKWSNLTNHFIFSADEGNQQRIFDESNLYANYLNAIKLRSGGTQKERARMTEALNFGGLDAEATRRKALSIYENFFQRQNNAVRVLKGKGYDEGVIFEALGEDGRNNFINNRKAYEYLKNNEFDRDEFERVYKYGEFIKGGKK